MIAIQPWKMRVQEPPLDSAIRFSAGDQQFSLDDGIEDLRTLRIRRGYDRVMLDQIRDAGAIRHDSAELRRGWIRFQQFNLAPLPADPGWNENPFHDRSWQWNLHSFAFIQPLLAAHMSTHDPWYLQRAQELVADWMHDNLTANPPSELSWHDHATGLRLEQLLLLTEYSLRQPSETEFFHVALRAIYVHASVLSDEAFYSRHTNHGLDQSLALYWAGSLFPEFADSGRWRDIGSVRIMDEIRFAFTAEGVHVENSPGYHYSVMTRLLKADELFRAYENKPLQLEDRAVAVGKVLEFAAHVLKPDGEFPLLGDTSAQRPKVTESLERFAGSRFHNSLLYALTQGALGRAPSETCKVFPIGGYAVFRDAWHMASDYAQSVHLVFKAGFLSTYHRQDDDLSVLLYGYGEDWLIDAGLYKYHEDDPMRQYMRSNAAHNVVLIDDLQMNRSKQDIGKSRIEAHKVTRKYAQVTGSHDLYPGFRVKRKVEYTKPSRIRITDWVGPEHDQPHRYRVLFHVPHDMEVIVGDQEAIVRSPRSKKVLVIKSAQEQFEKVYTVSGQREPEMQGWVSRTFGRVEPSVCIIFETHSNSLQSTIELEFSERSPST